MALRVANVTRTEASDERAFDRLFIQEYRRVVAVAYRVLDDAAEAEDVAQEAFVSFHRSHDPDVPYAAAWLHRAASHLALNAVRTRKRRSKREHDDALARVRLRDSDSISLDPAPAAEAGEERELVRRVLARMPKRSAQVLALRYGGLSYAEVAAALGCRVGDIGTILRRAEMAFRKELNRETPQ